MQMTRNEVYGLCIDALSKTNFLLVELPTGYGKSKLSIDAVNHVASTRYSGKPVSMLLLVAKRVHRQTWLDEISKWGGLHVSSLVIECYESLHKHANEHFDIIVMDEAHHVGSDLRLQCLSTIDYGCCIGLSATVPRKLKDCFLFQFHAQIVSCSTSEAIDADVLPEPRIVLFPLQLDNVRPSEVIEVNPKVKGRTYHDSYCNIWRYRKMKLHALVSCTELQKSRDYDSAIAAYKRLYSRTGQRFVHNKWLFECGERIKWLSCLKNDIVRNILDKLSGERTIVFCKTIGQAESLCQHCIHSKNKDSDSIYRDFNSKKINHIASVNILNENANLVDCQYAVFANYSSSEIVGVQRIGRALRHRNPIIIMPYYEGTREQEILDEMLKDFDKSFIRTIHSLDEL